MRRSLSILGLLAVAAAFWAALGTPACSSSSTGTAPDATDAGCTPVDAGPLDPNQIALGQALVKIEKCPKCHGDTLGGNFDGVMSCCYGQVYPPNLTNDPATGLGCWTDPQIQTAILDGLDNMNTPLCPPMPHFGDAGLDAAGVASIIQYLRSLPVVMNNVPESPDCTGPGDAGPQDSGGDAEPQDSGHRDGGKRDSGKGDSGELLDAMDAMDAKSDSPEVDSTTIDSARADAADAADARDATEQ
jgi:hypothetical protein